VDAFRNQKSLLFLYAGHLRRTFSVASARTRLEDLRWDRWRQPAAARARPSGSALEGDPDRDGHLDESSLTPRSTTGGRSGNSGETREAPMACG